MKIKAIILLLSGLLETVATILFGDEDSRLLEDKDEKRTLVYVALKTLRNAETFPQVLDAIGYFSEAVDFVEEDHNDVVEKLHDNETYQTELKADIKNLRRILGETQSSLGKAREENKILKHSLAEQEQELEQEKQVANGRLERLQLLREKFNLGNGLERLQDNLEK